MGGGGERMWVASRRGRLSCSNNTNLEKGGRSAGSYFYGRVWFYTVSGFSCLCLGSSLDAWFAVALSVDSC